LFLAHLQTRFLLLLVVVAAVAVAAAILAHLVLQDLNSINLDHFEVEQFQIYYLYNLDHL